jgi:hypothetical protein
MYVGQGEKNVKVRLYMKKKEKTLYIDILLHFIRQFFPLPENFHRVLYLLMKLTV